VKSTRIAVAALALAALVATPLAAQTPRPALQTTELGKGPVIVLLPGLGSQRMQWMPTARRLLGNYRVVMADLPGHGDSAMPDPFSLDAAAGMLDALLARQNPESTIVVAHGVGGMIAVLEAKAHPERMKGLIVIDGALKSPLVIPDQQKKFVVDFINENYDTFLRQMFKPLGRDSVQGVEIYSKAALVPSQNVKAYMRQLLDADATGAAKATRVPLLYVGSSKSWPDSMSWTAFAKQKGWDMVPQLKTRRIADSGYLIMADQPDSLAQVISDFAKQVLPVKDLASSN
jgi:pimeloyl-ACP methyl ester carboxylesterase